jgi:catechol 2,3-dioxygenase-like lactoylglutathione lyase family enzyme
MTIELNHTIVPARDPQASAQFLAGILGLEVDPPASHFIPVTLANRVTLDYDQANDFGSHHYAFLVSEEEFDAAFARIQQAGIAYFADPAGRQAGQIYHGKGDRRGAYFRDPNDHLMEILTPLWRSCRRLGFRSSAACALGVSCPERTFRTSCAGWSGSPFPVVVAPYGFFRVGCHFHGPGRGAGRADGGTYGERELT